MRGHCAILARALAGLALLGLVTAGEALAHSRAEKTLPEDGAVLSVAPEVISISFDRPMRITALRLTSATGDAFELEGPDASTPLTELRAVSPPLPEGRYVVEWRGLSADGHPVKGRFSFEIAR